MRVGLSSYRSSSHSLQRNDSTSSQSMEQKNVSSSPSRSLQSRNVSSSPPQSLQSRNVSSSPSQSLQSRNVSSSPSQSLQSRNASTSPSQSLQNEDETQIAATISSLPLPPVAANIDFSSYLSLVFIIVGLNTLQVLSFKSHNRQLKTLIKL